MPQDTNKEKCNGTHCKCMNLGEQCPNRHYYNCVDCNPDFPPPQEKKVGHFCPYYNDDCPTCTPPAPQENTWRGDLTKEFGIHFQSPGEFQFLVSFISNLLSQAKQDGYDEAMRTTNSGRRILALVEKAEKKAYVDGLNAGISDEQANWHFVLDDTKFADLMDGKEYGINEVVEYIKKLESLTHKDDSPQEEK